jgi:hypothetical protein
MRIVMETGYTDFTGEEKNELLENNAKISGSKNY